MDTQIPERGARQIVAGQFAIVKKLGEGGMGEVYLAEQLGIGRRVVLKLVHGHLLAESSELRERFVREARALAQLNHPNVVQLYTFGTAEDGRPYFAMELVDGRSLADELQQGGPLAERRALTIAASVADAISHAHEAGIVHRDLKPENVMLAARHGTADFVKVLDFGIAKLTQQTGPRLTQSQAFFGTPQYVAPEQAMGGQITAATDIYALGVMLFEMLTGQPLFEGASAFELLSKHVSSAPRAPSSVRREVSAAADAIVLRCLEKAPDARFSSAAELAGELRRVVGATSASESPSRPAGGTQRLAHAETPAPGGTRSMPSGSPAQAGGTQAIPSVEPPPAVTPPVVATSRWLRLWALVIPLFAVFQIPAVQRGLERQLLHRLWPSQSAVPVAAPVVPPAKLPIPAAPPEKPAAPKSNAGPSAAETALATFVSACMDGHAERGWDSYHRYLDWVDRETGPRPRRSVLGLYAVTDIDRCKKASDSLQGNSSFGEGAGRYFAALAALSPLTETAQDYYDVDAWKDDHMARGVAMHGPLMKAFDAFLGEERRMHVALTEHIEAVDRAALQAGGDASDARTSVIRLRVAARQLMREGDVPWRRMSTVDPALFDDRIARTAEAAEALKAASDGESIDTPRVLDSAKSFIKAARLMRHRLGGHPRWSTGERLNLPNPGSQGAVEGSPAELVKEYNKLVNAVNQTKGVLAIEARSIHMEPVR